MKLTLEQLVKIIAAVLTVAGLYYHAETRASVQQTQIEQMQKQLDKVSADSQWVERRLAFHEGAN